MTKRKGFWHGLIFFILALVLAGSMLFMACGKEEEETPIPTATPTATPMITIPQIHAGWQELPKELTDKWGVNYYVPPEWMVLTTFPMPTVVLALDPTLFPNSELREWDVEAGTTPAQLMQFIKDTYPVENGGEYSDFTVLEEGDMTLDCGLPTPYMIFKGARLGYSSQNMVVFIVKGTQGFVLSAGHYVVYFDESREMLTQVVKSFHPTTPKPTATATATATSTPTSSKQPVKLAVICDWSGPFATLGVYYFNKVMSLVEKQVKDEGGILGGREVKFLQYDNQGTTAGLLSAAKKATLQDNMPMLIMGGSNNVFGEVLSGFAEENHIPYADFLFQPYDISNLKYTIQISYHVNEETILAEYPAKVLKPATYGIIARDVSDMRYEAGWFKDIMGAAGSKLVLEDYVPMGTSDMSAYIVKIKRANPDVLITDLTMDGYATLAAQMMSQGGWGNTKVMASIAALFQLGKPGIEGWYCYGRWIPGMDTPGSKAFEAAWLAMYEKPTTDAVFPSFYDGLWWAVETIKLAGTDSDREAIAAASRSGNLSMETIAGFQTVGTDGVPYPLYRLLVHIENGKAVPVLGWE